MSNATTSEQDDVPRITLRILAPWKSPEQMQKALDNVDGGYSIPPPKSNDEIYLVHDSTGRRFEFTVNERDDEIVDLFAGSGRMRPKELDALEKHKVKLFVSGPGGSHDAARAFLDVGAAFIEAGALGIMVDNCGNCHSPQDWLDLAGDQSMGGMYWAFVSMTAGEDATFSAGMHCLGYRDAELLEPVAPRDSGMMLHEFLGYSYQSGVPIVDGDPIGGLNGPDFIVRHVPCTRFPKGTPWHNPYGVWRLEKFSEGDEDGEDDEE